VAGDAEPERAPAELREPIAEDLGGVPNRVDQLVPHPGHAARHRTAVELANVACRRRPWSGDRASVKTGTARPLAKDVEM
jgi:hypothetical protein